LKGKGKGVLTGEAIHSGVGQQRGTVAVEVDHQPRELMRWTIMSTERLRGSRRQRWGRRMAGVAHPRGGAWRLMGNRWWKHGSLVEAAGGWVGELRGAVLELRDGSGRSERGWSGLSAAAQ
jgi:hypothetical protein